MQSPSPDPGLTGSLSEAAQRVSDATGLDPLLADAILLSLAILLIGLIVSVVVAAILNRGVKDLSRRKLRRRGVRVLTGAAVVLALAALWSNEQIVNSIAESPHVSSTAIRKTLLSLAILGTLVAVRSVLISAVNARVTDIRSAYHWRRAVTYTVGILALVLLLLTWVSGIQDFGAFLGLITAGLAIALKDLLANLAGWVFILVRRPFVVGDRIEIAGRRGDVVDIRLFQTFLMECGEWVDADQSTGRVIMVPNGFVFQNTTASYTRGFEYIWDEIAVLVTFESDWKLAKKLLTEIANQHAQPLCEGAQDAVRRAASKQMIFFKQLTPAVYTTVKDFGVMHTIRYLTPPRQRRANNQRIWEAILEAFAAQDSIDFAYPTQRHYLNYVEGKRGGEVIGGAGGRAALKPGWGFAQSASDSRGGAAPLRVVITRRRHHMERLAVGVAALGVTLAGVSVGTYAWARQSTPPVAQNARGQSAGQEMPDLIGALRTVPGCLGVDAGQFQSGKQAIFAWFENKEAAMRWYNHDVHQGAMAAFMTDENPTKPMAGVPDNVPILAIASITFSDRPHFDEIKLPISQISIELYTPIKGGIHLGGTFAPGLLKVEGIRDLSAGE